MLKIKPLYRGAQMPKEPLVTVFMPVYNSEKYLKEALDSIINQTYKNLEILLVDDGSTDHSVNIIKSYSDRRIRLIENGENKGIPYTRNVGLMEATGKYIAIMDSDDISHPLRIEKQVEYMENNKHIDVAASYYYRFGWRFARKVRSPFIHPNEIEIMLLFYNPIANPSTILRKETLDNYNLKYNLNYFVSQDYQMWSQIIKVGKIGIIPEFLLKYRFGHENISKKSVEEKIIKRKKLIGDIQRDLLNHFDFELNDVELEIFNDFFTETYGDKIRQIDILEVVIDKLRGQNEEKGIFNPLLFNKVLDHCIVLGIEHQSLPLRTKLQLYNKLKLKQTLKEQSQIIVKHFYHKFIL